MSDASMELMHELLKNIQSTLSEHSKQFEEVKEFCISIREDIHGVRGDLLRHERAFASLESDVERIKARLDLVDQE